MSLTKLSLAGNNLISSTSTSTYAFFMKDYYACSLIHVRNCDNCNNLRVWVRRNDILYNIKTVLSVNSLTMFKILWSHVVDKSKSKFLLTYLQYINSENTFRNTKIPKAAFCGNKVLVHFRRPITDKTILRIVSLTIFRITK